MFVSVGTEHAFIICQGVPAKSSSILSKEEEEALSIKRDNLEALATDHEMMNTKTIEQATAERVCWGYHTTY